MVPVDPVALNVPQYLDIVKHPMDVSTLSKKLGSGVYSNIPPSENAGRSPVARMLNGPFRKDVELIFDNAMLFNPPHDWIHQAAGAVKKAVLKKIDQASASADGKSKARGPPRKSVYVEYDSDVDMYVYESDQDEDYGSSRRNRKRKRPAQQKVLKEDASARAIERPCRLQKIMSESTGLRGLFADLPVNSDPSTFALPSEWTCKHVEGGIEATVESTGEEDEEFDEVLALHKQLEETETFGLRRSTRSHGHDEPKSGKSGEFSAKSAVEYICTSVTVNDEEAPPRSRLEVELFREKLHEKHFAQLYKDYSRYLIPCPEAHVEPRIGLFSDESFPPYLGRIVPAVGSDDGVWEIQEPYVVPALRWVIRGLINSNHLTAVEDDTSDPLNLGAVLVNNAYYVDANSEPFEVLDSRELIRRKRADQEADESSEEEVELSEYEKLRAERVARNAERLKALGLT